MPGNNGGSGGGSRMIGIDKEAQARLVKVRQEAKVLMYGPLTQTLGTRAVTLTGKPAVAVVRADPPLPQAQMMF
jgi:hypothetical protein